MRMTGKNWILEGRVKSIEVSTLCIYCICKIAMTQK